MAVLEIPHAPSPIPPRVVDEDPDQTGTWWPPATLLPELAPEPAPSVAADWALEPPTGKTIDLFGPQELTSFEEEEGAFEREITQIEALPSGITLPPLPVIQMTARASLNEAPVPAEALVRQPASPQIDTDQLPAATARRRRSFALLSAAITLTAIGYWWLG